MYISSKYSKQSGGGRWHSFNVQEVREAARQRATVGIPRYNDVRFLSFDLYS